MESEATRLVDAGEVPGEGGSEAKLRPRGLQEYVGQPQVREHLEVFIAAARARGESLDHTLVFGPPGLGKTTLAHIIAHEMETGLKVTAGPVLEKPGDLAALLTNISPHEVLFIDEIHRLSPAVEEILYPAMEDYQLDIVIGEGPAARSIKLDIPPMTLVGATTRAGLLTAPLRERFGITLRLDFYNREDLARILQRSAELLELPMEPQGGLEIAQRCRGTPRVANRLLRRVRDWAQVRGEGVVTREIAVDALERLEIDSAGLDKLDQKLLQTLVEKFDGGPVGLESLAAAIGEEPDTIEGMVEPYLLQQGYIQRTARGRCATRGTYHQLGLVSRDTANSQGGLL